MVDVRRCSVEEFFAHVDAPGLLAEYAGECAIFGLPTPTPDPLRYRTLEDVGMLYVLAAFDGETMLGFVSLLAPTNAHYNVRLAVTESYFVAALHRGTGAGLALLRAAEVLATEENASGLLVSAPHGGRLAEVLPHVGYRETNRVFFKGLA